MADKTDQEPSIEEILASIRQIISDDDGGEGAPTPAAAEQDTGAAVLELTEILEKPPHQRIEVDMQETPDEPEPAPEPVVMPEPEPVAAAAPEPEPEPEPAPMPEPVKTSAAPAGDPILTNEASRAAYQGFAKLTNQMAIDRQSRDGGPTLEDIVREMVRPMLREWLDSNLPALIEKLVQKELDRLAQKALDE